MKSVFQKNVPAVLLAVQLLLLLFFVLSCQGAASSADDSGDSKVAFQLNMPRSVSTRQASSGRAAADMSLIMSLSSTSSSAIEYSDTKTTSFTMRGDMPVASVTFHSVPVGATVIARAALTYDGETYYGRSKETLIRSGGNVIRISLGDEAEVGFSINVTAGSGSTGSAPTFYLGGPHSAVKLETGVIGTSYTWSVKLGSNTAKTYTTTNPSQIVTYLDLPGAEDESTFRTVVALSSPQTITATCTVQTESGTTVSSSPTTFTIAYPKYEFEPKFELGGSGYTVGSGSDGYDYSVTDMNSLNISVQRKDTTTVYPGISFTTTITVNGVNQGDSFNKTFGDLFPSTASGTIKDFTYSCEVRVEGINECQNYGPFTVRLRKQ